MSEDSNDFGYIFGVGIMLGALLISPGCWFMFYGLSKWYIEKRLNKYGKQINGTVESKRRMLVGDGYDAYVWKYRYKYDYTDDRNNQNSIFGSIQDEDKNKYEIGDTVELVIDPKYKYVHKPVKYATNDHFRKGVCQGLFCCTMGFTVFLPTVAGFIYAGYFITSTVGFIVGIICVIPCAIYRYKRLKNGKLDCYFF